MASLGIDGEEFQNFHGDAAAGSYLNMFIRWNQDNSFEVNLTLKSINSNRVNQAQTLE